MKQREKIQDARSGEGGTSNMAYQFHYTTASVQTPEDQDNKPFLFPPPWEFNLLYRFQSFELYYLIS